MKPITEVAIVLASPSDTSAERDAAERVVKRLNDGYCREHALHVVLSRWENVSPQFHPLGPQGALDLALEIPTVDILVGIFWQRIGTPVKGGSASGTVHEFEQAYRCWKVGGAPEIMFYFKTETAERQPNVDEAEQFARLLRFKREFPGEGLYRDFLSTSEFEELLEMNLREVLGRLLSGMAYAPLTPASLGAAHRFQAKAVVFTHFGHLGDIDPQGAPREVAARYQSVLESYCRCQHVGIVYAYVDHFLRTLIASERTTMSIDEKRRLEQRLHKEERALIEWLEGREEAARKRLGMGKSDGPRFFYVGYDQLIELFDALREVDPKLIDELHGPGGKFTYDSPKFIEAVIRLARGDTAHLAMHPVVRIDEDARANDEAISLLLDRFTEDSGNRPYYFFSGCYGSSSTTDYLNDFAVRTHWFTPIGTRKADSLPELVSHQIETFLADISRLGARQLIDGTTPCSRALRELPRTTRPSPQVISGAGLIMSRKAVDLLPPFMNMGNMTVWVDDYLKRRLHETLGDISPHDIERDAEAKFLQDRHPQGVTPVDMKLAADYFPRLLRGCLFLAIIDGPHDSPTPYGRLIRDIVSFNTAANDERLALGEPDGQAFYAYLLETAKGRLGQVLQSWTSAEFADTELGRWVAVQGQEQADEFCKQVADDAIAYARLAGRWHIFVRAIQRLPYYGTKWLFEPVPTKEGHS
jgi:hypothetical protein